MAWLCGGYCCDVNVAKAESVRVPTTNVHVECVEFPPGSGGGAAKGDAAGSEVVEILPRRPPHRGLLLEQGAAEQQSLLNAKDAQGSEDGDLDDAKSTTAGTLNGGTSPCSAAPGGSRFAGQVADSVRSDFGGSWLLTAVDGDVPGFLADLGFPSRDREAARRSNYGVKRQSQHISQAGDAFVVRNTLNGTVSMSFRVGQGEQESLDQEGKKVVIVPVWDGGVLSVSSKRPSGESLAQSRRYFEGDSMVIEFESPKGTVMRRIFDRN